MSLQPKKKTAMSAPVATGSSGTTGAVRARRVAAAEPTPEEIAAAARAAAQAMAADPTLRRGYLADPTAALDSSGSVNASRTNALRAAQQDLAQRVAGLHDKVAREERQHRAEAGLAPKGKAVRGGSKPRSSAAGADSGAGMIDFGLDEFDDDDAFGGGGGLGSAAAGGYGTDAYADGDAELDAEMAAEDAAFAAEEAAYARQLAKESSRLAASHAAQDARLASQTCDKIARAARIDPAWVLAQTREKSLEEVRTLSLANQRLQSLPGVIAELVGLRSLDLSANVLRTLTTAATSGGGGGGGSGGGDARPLSRLSELRELKLQHNELRGLQDLSRCARDHPQLQSLRLDYNAVPSIPPGAFRECSKLALLSLGSNRLTGVPLGTLAASLTSLDLSHNALVSLAFLAELPLLREGFFSHNRLASPLPNLAKLAQLDELRLDHNDLDGFEGLGHCQRLSVLDLRHNRIRKICGPVFLPAPAPNLPVAAAAGAVAPSSSAAAAAAAARREPKAGLARSAAAAARENAAIDAATIAASLLKSSSSSSSSSSTASSSAAAAQQALLLQKQSFPYFPMLSELLLGHNAVAQVGPELAQVYPVLETLDLGWNKLAAGAAATLLERLVPLKGSLVELELRGNPFLEGADQAEGAGPAAATSGGESRPATSASSSSSAAATAGVLAPLSPRSYRSVCLRTLPLLESLDGAEVDRSGVDGDAHAQGQPPQRADRSTTSAGNVTPRPQSSASSRPSTAGPSRPGTAAGARPGSARRGGNPLMRPPSAARARPGADQANGALAGHGSDPSAAASAAAAADSSELAQSTASLGALSTRMEGQVRETAAQLAGFKARFEKLLAHSVAAITRRGLDSNITARSARGNAAEPGPERPVADGAGSNSGAVDSESARDHTFMTTTAASARAQSQANADAAQVQAQQQADAHSPERVRPHTQSGFPAPHSSPLSSRGANGAAGPQPHFATPTKSESRPSTSGGERRGATTPRQRLEQAKLFSNSVYGAANGLAAGSQDLSARFVDELTGELLPASLSKSRATSAPYKPQHSKPSFSAPGQPLPALAQPPQSPSAAAQTAAAAATLAAEQQQQQQQPSKPSTPSRITTAAARAKKPSAASSVPSAARPVSSGGAGGLFDSPFTEMKPVPSRAAAVTAAAKAAIAASKVAAAAGGGVGVGGVSSAGAGVPVSMGLKSSPSAKTLPATRAVPISTGVGSVGTRVQASAPVSANRPVVPGGNLAPNNAAAGLGLGISGRSVAAAASDAHAAASAVAASSSPAPLTIRQQLIAAKLAQAAASPPEELSLDGEDDDADEQEADNDGSGTGSLKQLARRTAAEEEEEDDASDPSASLFARPWSAHARAAHSALNSARSRPQSAARTRAPADLAAELEGDAPYAAFHVPRRGPDSTAALQQQLRSQMNVANAYAHAFAQRSPAPAVAPATTTAAVASAGQPFRSGAGAGGQTPRGPRNPFLLHNPMGSN